MQTPILKYYIPSNHLSLKLKVFLTQRTVVKLSLDTPTKEGVECLFYSTSHPCQKRLLNLTTKVLLWLQAYLAGKDLKRSFSIKIDPLYQYLSQELDEITFGTTVLAEHLKTTLTHKELQTTISKNPYLLLIPTHRIISHQTPKSSSTKKISEQLLEFEKLLTVKS